MISLILESLTDLDKKSLITVKCFCKSKNNFFQQ